MRTDAPVGGKEVLSVVLSDVPHLTYTQSAIKRAIMSGKYGDNKETKDFLKPGENSMVVKRGIQSTRRRCTTILLQKLDEEDCARLRQCKCYNSVDPLVLRLLKLIAGGIIDHCCVFNGLLLFCHCSNTSSSEKLSRE